MMTFEESKRLAWRTLVMMRQTKREWPARYGKRLATQADRQLYLALVQACRLHRQQPRQSQQSRLLDAARTACLQNFMAAILRQRPCIDILLINPSHPQPPRFEAWKQVLASDGRQGNYLGFLTSSEVHE